jgi:hypothetical protein
MILMGGLISLLGYPHIKVFKKIVNQIGYCNNSSASPRRIHNMEIKVRGFRMLQYLYPRSWKLPASDAAPQNANCNRNPTSRCHSLFRENRDATLRRSSRPISKETDIQELFGFDTGAVHHLGGGSWCEAPFVPKSRRKCIGVRVSEQLSATLISWEIQR